MKRLLKVIIMLSMVVVGAGLAMADDNSGRDVYPRDGHWNLPYPRGGHRTRNWTWRHGGRHQLQCR